MYQYNNRDINRPKQSQENNESSDKEEKSVNPSITSVITLKEFFDFLSCSCKAALDSEEKLYKELLCNDFVSRLLGVCVEKFKFNVEVDDGSNSESYSLNRESYQESFAIQNTHEEEKEIQQGVRSLLIKINRKNDNHFSFSHLPILEAENILKQKVEEVINEGVLDSMFSFLICKFNISSNVKNIDNFALSGENQKGNRQTSKPRARKTQDPQAEIEIQVCDEVNNVSKNFKCSQSLLLSKMEYFAEVTEGQRLEDMDISVHCDVAIFEWLMKWVHRPVKGMVPVLSVNNVTPILISAMFLRMEPLVDESVNFFKDNIKEIIETTISLSCLSDNILEKIADTMTNVELDSLEDPADKIQSKLFTKFIISLGKRKVEKRKGHYSTLASLYRCFYCKKILHEELGHSVPCIPDLLAVDSFGNILGRHKEDTSWNLNSYIKQLKRELLTWQKVYWKLWGTCHYLRCIKCKENYPIVLSLCCRYHPNGVHFGVRPDCSNVPIPVGRFVCCGALTYRFDVLSLPNGCSWKSHMPLENELTTKLISILELKKDMISGKAEDFMYLQEKFIYERQDKDIFGSIVGCNTSWRPLSRGNHNDKLYSFNDIVNSLDEKEKESDGDTDYEPNCMKSTIEEIENDSSDSEFNDLASIGDGEDSDGSCSSKKYSSQPKSQINSKLWTTSRSIRFNQDNQREREEKIIKCIINKLNRTKNDEFDIFLANNDYSSCNIIEGGVYAMLEEEWREESLHAEISNNTCFTPSRSNPRNTKYACF